MENETKTFPLYLIFDKRYISVLGLMDDPDIVFQDGKGYVKDGFVWVYSKKKPEDSKLPYFWHEHGEILFGKLREDTREAFKEENLKDGSLLNTVFRTDPNAQLYDEAAITDMQAATSIFTPTINETDDFLKKIIKTIIIAKKININRLKSRMDKSYSLSNMKTALMNSTKMSTPNFIIWCDLLGVSFDIFIQDNGTDPANPLKGTIHYSSETDSFDVEA